ncbi:hypothetical protein [Streptomyces chartreusis]|uniref:hypothetical protein n=1 Tax=Streptomyces chartreusis TaxID=1969 RepID=UPI003690BFE7
MCEASSTIWVFAPDRQAMNSCVDGVMILSAPPIKLYRDGLPCLRTGDGFAQGGAGGRALRDRLRSVELGRIGPEPS